MGAGKVTCMGGLATVEAVRGRATFLGALLVMVGGCSDPPIASEDRASPTAQAEPTAVVGDPLLARARTSIIEGRIDAGVASAISTSEAPAHARARRILAVMDATEDPSGASEAVDDDTDVPAIVAPPPGQGDVDVPPVPSASHEPAETPSEAASGKTEPAPAAAPSRDRGTLTRMALSGRAKGATLTLFASGGVLVGVANQRDSKIVRLVVETDRATSEVLGSRPRIEGVRVTGIRRGSGSVFITLELEEGWSLGKIERFSGGARVRLSGPG